MRRIGGHAHATPDYLRVRLTENGTGMSDEVARRAFEPFVWPLLFDQGKPMQPRLGVGLAFGCVKQSGGQTELSSTPRAKG